MQEARGRRGRRGSQEAAFRGTAIFRGTARAAPPRGVSGAVQQQRADLLEVLADKAQGATAAKLWEVIKADEMVMQASGCQGSPSLPRGLISEPASAFEPAAAAERGSAERARFQQVLMESGPLG